MNNNEEKNTKISNRIVNKISDISVRHGGEEYIYDKEKPFTGDYHIIGALDVLDETIGNISGGGGSEGVIVQTDGGEIPMPPVTTLQPDGKTYMSSITIVFKKAFKEKPLISFELESFIFGLTKSIALLSRTQVRLFVYSNEPITPNSVKAWWGAIEIDRTDITETVEEKEQVEQVEQLEPQKGGM